MTKMRNRFTELKQERPEPLNASLLEVLACRVDRPVLPHQPVLRNSQHAAAQLPGLFTQVNLQSSFTDLPAVVFRVESQATGELLVQMFFFLQIQPISRPSVFQP